MAQEVVAKIMPQEPDNTNLTLVEVPTSLGGEIAAKKPGRYFDSEIPDPLEVISSGHVDELLTLAL